MISVEGASLIAQVFPLGMILIVFESRSILRFARTAKWPESIWFRYNAILAGIALIGVIVSETTCITAVSSGQALQGFGSGVVYVTGSLLSLSVSISLFSMFWRAILTDDE